MKEFEIKGLIYKVLMILNEQHCKANYPELLVAITIHFK